MLPERLPRLLLTAGAAIYGLVVPILEVNATHVFDPLWPPHARLHEVWQLTTNSALALFCVWLVWRRKRVVLPTVIAALVTGGFLVAYTIRNSYGGSMRLSSGIEHTVLGLNIGVVGFVLVNVLSALALALRDRETEGGGA